MANVPQINSSLPAGASTTIYKPLTIDVSTITSTHKEPG